MTRDTTRRIDRRRLLRRVATAATVAVGGCTTGDPADSATPTDDPEGTATTGESTEDPSTTDEGSSDGENGAVGGEGDDTTDPDSGTTDGDLDLREANVTAVVIERRDGSYRFDVTLYHDDDGEEGYANWWQVETLDGDRLGRRDLLHAHGTREFERSATIDVPAGTTCVVVRGHDRTHGYGGQAMLVALDSGETTTLRQGPDPQSVADADCP